jgi:DNA-binding MarR family transcriptional regulator
MQLHLCELMHAMTKIRPETTKAWTALMRANRILLERVESVLKNAGFPPLGWYDALLEIERAGQEGLRPFELKERLLLPQYSMSRLLDRMEKAGYIRRVACDEDGRGQTVIATEAGLRIRQDMWPVYAGFLADAVQNRLPPDQLQNLAEKLRCLAAPETGSCDSDS